VRVGLGVGIVLLLVVAAPRVAEPSALALFQAVRDLGPISGWRCANSAVYVYDPRRDSADSTLLSDAPEAALPGVQAERVEANLRDGDTVVWTRLEAPDGSEERRVYVLSPGRLRAIALERTDGWIKICNSHLGDWHVVAEHTLG
jgi:hypothetical protein